MSTAFHHHDLARHTCVFPPPHLRVRDGHAALQEHILELAVVDRAPPILVKLIELELVRQDRFLGQPVRVHEARRQALHGRRDIRGRRHTRYANKYTLVHTYHAHRLLAPRPGARWCGATNR